MSDDTTSKIVARVSEIINRMVDRMIGPDKYSATASRYSVRFASIAMPALGCSVHVGDCVETIAALVILFNFTMQLLQFCSLTLNAGNDADLLAKQTRFLAGVDTQVATWKQTKICG